MNKAGTFLPGPGNSGDDDAYTIDFDNPEKQKTAHDEALETFLRQMAQADSEARIQIKRQDGDGRSPMQHVCSFPVDKFTFDQLLEHLREQWGGGDYRLQIVDKSGMVANRLVSIAQPKTAASAPSVGGEVAQVLGQVLQTLERQQQQIMELSRGGDDRRQLLEDMKIYRELFAPPAGATAQGGSMMDQLSDTLTVLKELGVEIGAGKEREEPGFWDVLDRATPLFERLAESKQPQAAAAPANPQPNPQPRGQKPVGDWALRVGLSQLHRAAQKNSDPGAYAQMIVDQIPPERITEFFTADGNIGKIIQLKPELAAFQPWVNELAEHVKALVGLPSQVADQYADPLTGDGERDTKAQSLGASDETREPSPPEPDELKRDNPPD